MQAHHVVSRLQDSNFVQAKVEAEEPIISVKLVVEYKHKGNEAQARQQQAFSSYIFDPKTPKSIVAPIVFEDWPCHCRSALSS